MRKTLTSRERCFLTLLKSLLHPSEHSAILHSGSLDPASMNPAAWESLFRLASSHHLEIMFFQAVSPFIPLPNARQYTCWKEKIIQYKIMEQCQRREWELITESLEQNCIGHISFKGFDFKRLYPDPSLRQMSDLDFFVRKEDRKRVREILEGLSYETKHFGTGSQDVYYQSPAVYVEVHSELSSERIGRMDNRYFQQAFLDTLDRPSSHYHRELSDLVSCAYMISHLAKHYLGYGTGVRSVLDIYFLSKTRPDLAQSKDFLVLLKRTGLLDFYRHLLKLSEIWFDDTPSEPLYDQIGAYIMQSGIYGHRKNHAQNMISRDKKATAATYSCRHLLRLGFPPVSHMKARYPWAGNYPFLLPASYSLRAVEILLSRRERLRLFQMTRQLSYDEIRELRKLHKRTGLY